MEGRRGRVRPRQKLLDWMMSEGYSKFKKKLNIVKHEGIGGQTAENLKRREE